MNVQTMRESRAQNADKMQAILDTVEAEGRALTAEEGAEFDRLKEANKALKANIERAEALAAEKEDIDAVRPSALRGMQVVRPAAEAKREFSSFGEFMAAVRFNKNDQRLEYKEFQAEQTMGTGTEGGFAVPVQFRPTLLEAPRQAANIRPRATVLEAGTPPDAEITMPALDQTAATGGPDGGVTVTWISEGGTKPETDAAFKEVSLTPKEVAAHIVVTDKLLRNWGAADSVLRTLLGRAIVGAEEMSFLSGVGSTRPLGLTNAGNTAAIGVNRGVAATISYADTVSMLERFIGLNGGNGIWIGSRAVIPQLMQMEDTAGNLVWAPDGRAGIPNTLHGMPVIIDDRLAIALGARGDLGLYDLSYYLIKDGSGPFVDASPHVHFTSNKTVIKAFWNVDGKPWLTAPVELESGSTASPFVLLDVPA